MYSVKNIEHKSLNDKDLIMICDIKSIFGDYSLSSQKNWMQNNLKDSDIHFLLYKSDILVGYANLVHTILNINEKDINIIGVGNVCVSTKSHGFGQKLMLEVNEYIIKQANIGLLFCKLELRDFYTRLHWKSVKIDNINDVYSMILNQKSTGVIHLKYNEELF